MQVARTHMQTTILGIAVIISALTAAVIAGVDGDPDTIVNYNHVVTEILAGVALIRAADGKNVPLKAS